MTDLWCFGSSFGSGAPRMSVAGPSRRLPSCRRRKRLRPGVGWWGSPVRFIVDLGCGYPFLVWFVFLWLLFSGVWETLIFGTGDWFAFGEPFFCGLFTPTYPLPGHRLVPESHFVFVFLGGGFGHSQAVHDQFFFFFFFLGGGFSHSQAVHDQRSATRSITNFPHWLADSHSAVNFAPC